MTDTFGEAVQRVNQVAKLFDNHLAKGRILVRYALSVGPQIEKFQVEIVDLEKVVYGGGVGHIGLVHMVYHGGIHRAGVYTEDCVCKVYGPHHKMERVTVREVFGLVTSRWKNLPDPVVIDDKCLWMEPDAFVGCVKPRHDAKGLSTIFPTSNTHWVFPHLCLFSGQFSSLVKKYSTVNGIFESDILDSFIGRFHSFFAHNAWYKTLGKPAG